MASTAAEDTMRSPGEERSQVLDNLIMGTNSSSIVSKRSVEKFYYRSETEFLRYFVHKFQRRSPLINRGYWLRQKAIDHFICKFLSEPTTGRKKVIINLGCGSDVLPWRCNARYPDACQNVLFVDVDYPDLMHKKRDTVLSTPQLHHLLEQDYHIADAVDEPVLLQSRRYCQLGCDLRDLRGFRSSLERVSDLSKSNVLFVAEVSITYMDTESADALIKWASSLGNAQFCLLEQLLPHGPDHPFAKTMLTHFDKLKTPPKSVKVYPAKEHQCARFRERQWRYVEALDLWDFWCSSALSHGERISIDAVEPFDEWEEFLLFCRHYIILHAKAFYEGLDLNQPDSQELQDDAAEMGINVRVEALEGCSPRRFGNIMHLPTILGHDCTVHLMGLGTTGRSDTYDCFGDGENIKRPRLPLAGPAQRMCATLTDLGHFGILLTGGRNSPSKPMSDCWILSKARGSSWQRTWPLPMPLYRHAALALGKSGLVLVAGGKTASNAVSDSYWILNPDRGWLACDLVGQRPTPRFGLSLCCCNPGNDQPDIFEGLLFGGIGANGLLSCEVLFWKLDLSKLQPQMSFNWVERVNPGFANLAVFGAQVVQTPSQTYVCGGVGQNRAHLGQKVQTLSLSDNALRVRTCRMYETGSDLQASNLPFLIGSAIRSDGENLFVVGGGATCFSMGTFWETRTFTLRHCDKPSQMDLQGRESLPALSFIGSLRVIHMPLGDPSSFSMQPLVQVRAISKIEIKSEDHFRRVVQERQPMVLDGLHLGDCLKKWNAGYLVKTVGPDRPVVVHECLDGDGGMDFRSKNFQYVTQPFDCFMRRAESGASIYLRALSHAKPSELPANLEADFPRIAPDFSLPPELDFVRDRLFSSVLRISGKAQMWLHYDVMANVYAQVMGARRLILFPPADIARLHVAPGASSSSLDVFAALREGTLTNVHPVEAHLEAGQVLFIPPFWLHTASPSTSLSVAVNCFFKDLTEGYSQSRDVYGNKDLAVYDKGRQDVSRLVKAFDRLPADARQFYLLRIADELVALANEG